MINWRHFGFSENVIIIRLILRWSIKSISEDIVIDKFGHEKKCYLLCWIEAKMNDFYWLWWQWVSQWKPEEAIVFAWPWRILKFRLLSFSFLIFPFIMFWIKRKINKNCELYFDRSWGEKINWSLCSNNE